MGINKPPRAKDEELGVQLSYCVVAVGMNILLCSSGVGEMWMLTLSSCGGTLIGRVEKWERAWVEPLAS